MSRTVDGIVVPDHDFGNYGCLNIAKKYGVDYGAPLAMVHLLTHRDVTKPGYGPVPGHDEMIAVVPEDRRLEFLEDCGAVAEQILALHRIAEGRAARGELVFRDGEWHYDPQESHS